MCDAIVQPLARFGCGLPGGAADGRIIGQIGEKELEDRATQSASSRSEGGTVPKYSAIQRAGTTRLNWLTISSLPPDWVTICCAVFVTNAEIAAMSCLRMTLRMWATSRS